MFKINPVKLLIMFVCYLLLTQAFYVIVEGRQAVITQFGKPVRIIKKSGMHFKIPFVEDVRKIDSRILNWDGYPNQIPTKDKKYIEVDTTARWKIVDPLKFIQTVQDQRGARTRLDAILDGVTRDIISSQNLVESVRSSNEIIELIAEKKKTQVDKNEADVNNEGMILDFDEEVFGDIEKINKGREQLSSEIITAAKEKLEPLGVALIDLQLKRISYEKSVKQKVYLRMISERERIAEKIRSVGQGERAKIEGKTQKELKRIQSEAYKKVQEIKGEAEAESIMIYAKSLSKAPEFYEFIRSLEAYEKTLSPDKKLLFSTEAKFWKYLK